MPFDDLSRLSSINLDAATERTSAHMFVSDFLHKNRLSLSAFPIKNFPSRRNGRRAGYGEENMVR